MSLTELVRRGDRTMIQFAVELEVSQFLGREYYRNDPGQTAFAKWRKETCVA